MIPTCQKAVKHLTRFIANIRQIHPFGEGNTRTTAVFTIKYLNSLGFEVNNDRLKRTAGISEMHLSVQIIRT